MTDYLRLAQERAPAAAEEQDNPYLPLAHEQQTLQQNRARTVIETALKDDPELAAERLRLSQTSGLPPDVVQRNLEELRVKERARAIDLADLASESPVLYRQIVDPTFATTSIDDLDTLKNIERSIGKGVRYVMGADGKGGLPTDAGGAAVDLGLAATAGVGEMIFNLAGTVNDLIGWQSGAAGARAQANASREARNSFGLQAETSTGQAVKSGLQSAGTNLAILPLGLSRTLFATANQAAATVAGIMATGVGADAYLTAREKGRGQGGALAYAIPQAAFEYVFEQIPASKLFGDIAVNTGLLKTLGKQVVSEGWTEQVTTLAQDFNEWMNLNPEKTLGQFIEERPEAAYQTFVATLVGVGVQTSTIKGINTAIEKFTEQKLSYDLDAFNEQLKLAGQSLLRERSPEQFRDMVQRVVDENPGAKSEIFVDGGVLAQLPPEMLEQLPDEVRAQIPGAVASNGTVAIPMADVLTLAPGTPMEQMLNDNARMTPEGLSRVEAQQASETAAETLRQDAERIVAEAKDQQAMIDSAEKVKTTVLDQLNTAGRFAPDVNEAYATLVRDFYVTTAASVGVTPEEMYVRYPLRVAGEAQQGAALEQITPEQAMDTNVPVEMPTAPEFAEAVTNTPGAQITENGLLMDLVRFQKPEQEGAQAIRTGVFYLPAKSANTKHYRTSPSSKNSPNPYGGTEKMEGQTLIRRPLFVKGATGGKAPEAAYDAIKGKGAMKALDKAVMEVVTSRGWMNKMADDLFEERVQQFLTDQGGDPGLAWEIIQNSKVGNTLRYALQEHVIAHTVRNAGYDAVVGYSKGKAGAAISEVFDVREQTFPARGMDSEVHEDFLNQSPLPPTIDVNGTQRPTVNSNGQPIAGDEQGVRAFWEWFGESKAVDAEGRPLVVYHGTLNDFSQFDPEVSMDGGFHFGTAEAAQARNDDQDGMVEEEAFTPNLMPVYLAIRNPMRVKDMGGSTDAWRSAIAKAKKAGHDGLVYENEWEGAGGNSYVAFRPEQIKSATGNRGTFDPANPDILEQGPRGTFNPERLLITLNENADLSTFLHESGHFFLEVMADIASQAGAPARIAVDMQKLLKWFGVPDLATWNGYSLDEKRPYHEKFAESFEQYLLEGKAPSQELQPLFRRFRSWLVNVYKSLTQFMRGRDLKVSDEIRQVFDRLIATDEQIAAAEQTAGMLPDFDATNEAIEKLQARSLRDMKWLANARSKAIKALQKQAAELRKGIEAEVRAEVEAQPIYRAMTWLKKGETVDPATGEQVKAEKGFRLNTGALAEMYPESMLARPDLAGLKGMTAKDGMHPDLVADMFGFTSGDALVRNILDAEPIASVIEGMVDQRMLERHGDLVDQRAIEEAANDAIHNETRARILATELKTQAEALNPRQQTGTASNGRAVTVNAIEAAAKQFAANVVSRTNLRDMKSRAAQHRAAEARAGKAWQQATAKGDTQAAVQAKRDQVLNNATAKALQEAQAEVKKTLEFFKRVIKDGNEATVDKGRDPDVVNAARSILAAYGIETKLTKRAADYMEVLAKNDPAMHAALQPYVDGALQMAQPIEALTFEELQGLRDVIGQLWYLSKRSRQMEIDGNLMDLEDAEAELQDRMQAIGVPLEVPGEASAITPAQKRARWLQHAGSLLRRVEQWAEGMDGKFGGPFLRLVFQPVKEAANRYRADRVVYRKKYQALVDAVAPHLVKGEIAAPELGYTFGKGHNGIGHAELLHAILHTGNASNKRKLLLGRKWATENADGTLDTSRWDAFVQRMQSEGKLTQAHYDFAQGVWDLLEQTKPLAQKAHRDVFGRYFDEVTADSFDTPFGAYRGGYVPAQADPRVVQDADLRKLAELENENMSFSFPTTNKGFTKGRVEYNRPLLLDLRTIGQHIDKVLLFAHMEPAVRDVNKLLSRKGVSYSLGRIDPTVYAGMLTPWLNRSARQIVETPIIGDGGISRVLSAARSRAGMSLMFANISNSIQQLTGFSTAFAKLKADGLESHMLRATAQFISSPKKMAQAVSDASAFMTNRMENEIAAINDAMDDILLDPNLYEKAQAWTRKHAYFMQTAMANTMEPIIWTAGYNAALQKGMSEADAVRYADGLIRQTQGSTLPEDVSRIETGPAYARMFTQFIGYFNMMANTNATGLKQVAGEMGLKKGAGKALMLVTLGMLVPLWIAEAIAQAMRGGPEDEDDDGYLDDWLAAVFGMGTIKGTFAMVPFVGQLANAAINRFNGNPADDKVSLSPAVSLLEGAAGVPVHIYKAITDPDKLNARNAVRDVASAVSIATGLPAVAVARPLGYLAGVADDRVEPTGPVDLARGLATGSASPQSK